MGRRRLFGGDISCHVHFRCMAKQNCPYAGFPVLAMSVKLSQKQNQKQHAQAFCLFLFKIGSLSFRFSSVTYYYYYYIILLIANC